MGEGEAHEMHARTQRQYAGGAAHLDAFEMEPWERKAFEGLEAEHEVRYVEAPLSAANVDEYADAEAISVFIYSSVDAQVLKRLERLEFIGTGSIGRHAARILKAQQRVRDDSGEDIERLVRRMRERDGEAVERPAK